MRRKILFCLTGIFALLSPCGFVLKGSGVEPKEFIKNGILLGESGWINDTLYYEAPKDFPVKVNYNKKGKPSLDLSQTELRFYKNKNIQIRAFVVIQDSTGQFTYYNFIDGNGKGEDTGILAERWGKMKLLPGTLNGKPCNSIGMGTHRHEDTSIGARWYPILNE